MGVKRCAWGECNSDSRYASRLHMIGVFFIRFPKPKSYPDKCDRWIRACCRADHGFGRHSITPDTYVCSKHFVGGNGPTLDHPDPFPANARPLELTKFAKKRKAPTERLSSTLGKKTIQSLELEVNKENEAENELEEENGHITDSGSQNRADLYHDVHRQPLLEHSYCSFQNEGCQSDSNFSGSSTDSTFPNSIDLSAKSDAGSSMSSVHNKPERPQLVDASTQTSLTFNDISGYSDEHLKDPALLKRRLFVNDIFSIG